ncbi:MAG: ABC transporter substrate-binding protein [Pseudomonadota bacterium]|uniref:ABC transporter substrate-binding protein n=1 Tax=Methylophaga aminisulfidivorans TaxID=230105 RepID=UPI0024E239FC|nr:ABC transporter substrate-binding protein [Methylophaga aminisulfidivorans]MEC9412360.1 ABC transporter substrate-binding protein [Pseudomonadota bacterium]
MNLKWLFIIFVFFYSGAAYTEENTKNNDLKHVTIKLHWEHQFQFAGIYAAKEKGFYRQAGLDVEILSGYNHPYDEVENGNVDFGISGTGIVMEYMKGRPFVALGATFQSSPYVWLVKADSGIYSAADFIGRTINRQSEADDLTAIFLQQHVDTSKINFVPPSKNYLNDLISGRIDGVTAYISNEPFYMQEQNEPYRVISPRDYGINFYSDILFTTEQYIDDNPDLVDAFRNATYQGWTYTAEHTDEIIDLVLEKYNPQHKTPAHVHYEAEQLLKLSLYPTVEFGHITVSRWKQIADVYESLGINKKQRDLDEFIYTEPDNEVLMFKWLVMILGSLSLVIIIFYLFKRHHNRILTEEIQTKTESIKQELENRSALEATAKQESLKLQTLLDNTIDSVITIDGNGIIVSFNKASVQLYGYEADEIIGQNITALMPASYRDMHKLGMSRFLSTDESRIIGKPIELEALHKSGTIFPIELTISHFKWDEKHFFTGIARDISRQKAEQKALVQAKLEAERANKAKSEFLSAMSHELRTPLNGILGFSQLLLTDNDPPPSQQQRHQIKQIIESGEHLLNLINDVLELSKIESGNIQLSTEHIPIKHIFDACLPMLETMAKKYDVEITLPEQNDTVVVADLTKLKQVFINLVTNAIKYNKAGGQVIITTRLVPQNGCLKMTITDTGHGIPIGKQVHVFTAFERLGQEYANIEGSGVGLSISKRLIEAMGGKIDFASTEGQGSSFWIELPLSTQQPAWQSEQRPALEALNKQISARRNDTQLNTEPRHVLYIEDNPANIRLIEVFFSRYPHVTFHNCVSAEDGLEFIHQQRPDLILMDINLPGMSGIEATRILKNSDQFKDIAVIALTAAAMQENKDSAKGLFTAYVTKPIDFAQLTQLVRPYL